MTKKVIVLYLEGVVLHVRSDYQQLRRQIRRLFSQQGIKLPELDTVASARRMLPQIRQQHAELATQIETLIQEDEAKSVAEPLLLPGFQMLSQHLKDYATLLVSRVSAANCLRALEKVGIPRETFSRILHIPNHCSENEELQQIYAAIREINPQATACFFIGATTREINLSRIAHRENHDYEFQAIGVGEDRDMASLAPSYLVTDLGNVPAILENRPSHSSLSVVLLAYNEAASINSAVTDAAKFCERHFKTWEIIVVNDGSTDQTQSVVEGLMGSMKNLKLINHQSNMGMGASMRDGYTAAQKEYVTMLPGDRQIRAASLIALLPYLDAKHVVVSDYLKPHSGWLRAIQSSIFRAIMRKITGLTVNFEAAYIFPRDAFLAVEGAKIATNTFFYSFLLLERMRRYNCRFFRVFILPFNREFGSSKSSNLKTILRLLVEMWRNRAQSA